MNSKRVSRDAVPAAQFCDDATLLGKVGSAMCNELNKGNAVVSIATGTHRRLLETQLAVQGINIVGALNSGQYACLNALDVLSTIVVAGAPDVIRFAEVVGALVDRTAANYGRVLIFGELVPLMRANGQHAGADALQKLWLSFVGSRAMFLHCDYPGLVLHDYSSISFSYGAPMRDAPPTWAVVRGNLHVGLTSKPPNVNRVTPSTLVA